MRQKFRQNLESKAGAAKKILASQKNPLDFLATGAFFGLVGCQRSHNMISIGVALACLERWGALERVVETS